MDFLPTFALLVSYLGDPFCGFSKQDGLRTVQGEIERALQTIFRAPIQITCAGRTDSGVHARGQVVSFSVEPKLVENKTEHSICKSIDALTHETIRARKLMFVPQDFSARFNAMWREYRYRFYCGKEAPLFSAPYTWWASKNSDLDIEAMRQAAQYLIGEHDFKSFCVTQSAEGKNTVRELMSIDIYEEDLLGEPAMVLRVVGNAFLHSMVRTLMGTLLEVGIGRRSPEWVQEVLEAKNRADAGQTAPANGLVLWHVEYPDPVSALDPIGQFRAV